MGIIRSIKTIEDLAQLPDDELVKCLTALRGAIVETKRQHAIAVRQQLLAPVSRVAFPTFSWRAPEADNQAPAIIGPETPIADLPLRPSARRALHDRHVICVEDLSAVSEQELLRAKAIGAKTLGRLREMLKTIGLDFMPNPHPRRRSFEESKAVRALPVESRATVLHGLGDEAPLSSLGLRNRTLSRALRLGFATLGDLRGTSPSVLASDFGRSECREIYAHIRATGRAFLEPASEVELWRHGLVDRDELAIPSDPATPIADLRPWLGAACKALQQRGIATLDALQQAAAQGVLSEVSGIGQRTAKRVLSFLKQVDVEPVDDAPPTSLEQAVGGRILAR